MCSSSLDKICCVIDFDGFFLNKQFLVRELGLCSLTKKENNNKWNNKSIRFNLTKSVKKMTDKDWKTNQYVKRHINGLTIKPMYKEPCIDEDYLEQVILDIYNENKTDFKYLMAFKGGIYEKHLLEKLNIPWIDIEQFGCPKFENLVSLFVDDLKDIENCGYHQHILSSSFTDNKSKTTIIHCAKIETLAFARWILSRLEKKNGLRINWK